MHRMFRLCSESLTVVDWISLLITEQVFIIIGYMRFVKILRSDLILEDNQLFTADIGNHQMSQSRLRLIFKRICACRKLTEITSTPS
jgi:hypothetical protein